MAYTSGRHVSHPRTSKLRAFCSTCRRPGRTLLATGTLFFVILQVTAPSSAAASQIPAVVTRVVDGDTVEARIGIRQETVRLIGIDTPETVHPRVGIEPWGPQASAFTKGLLPPGTPVRLELGVQERDRYGRLLAYVYLSDGRMLNALLLKAGLAQLLTIPPNVRDRHRLLAQPLRPLPPCAPRSIHLGGACPRYGSQSTKPEGASSGYGLRGCFSGTRAYATAVRPATVRTRTAKLAGSGRTGYWRRRVSITPGGTAATFTIPLGEWT